MEETLAPLAKNAGKETVVARAKREMLLFLSSRDARVRLLVLRNIPGT